MPLIQQRSRISTPKIPRWPYRINPSSWQANGLIGWYPLVGNLGYGYDFSLYGRNLDTNSGVTWTSDTEGGEVPLFDGASGLSSAAGNLYIASNHISNVIRVDPDSRVFVVAGTEDYGYAGDGGLAVEAVLAAPFGVLPAAEGGFYISDTEAHVVRHVDAAGIIATVAGTGERGYGGDGGPGAEAQLDSPTRIRADADGQLYICDTRNHRIRRVDLNGVIATFAGTGVRGFSGDGGAAVESELNSPHDLRFTEGDLYVADAGNNVIRKIDANGVISTVVGTGIKGYTGDGSLATDARVGSPTSIRFDARGNLYFSDSTYNVVRTVNAETGIISTVTQPFRKPSIMLGI